MGDSFKVFYSTMQVQCTWLWWYTRLPSYYTSAMSMLDFESGGCLRGVNEYAYIRSYLTWASWRFIVLGPAILIEVMHFYHKTKPGRNFTRGQREKEREIERERLLFILGQQRLCFMFVSTVPVPESRFRAPHEGTRLCYEAHLHGEIQQFLQHFCARQNSLW